MPKVPEWRVNKDQHKPVDLGVGFYRAYPNVRLKWDPGGAQDREQQELRFGVLAPDQPHPG
jgi:hypothetical protein